jgi:hypothetical protein
MSTLEDYANKYRTIRMERRHGILQMTLHTEGARSAGACCRTASCPTRFTMWAATARTGW